MPSIEILGRQVALEFIVGEEAVHALDPEALTEGGTGMAALINSITWPPHYADAFRKMTKIVFFEGKVMVNGYLMDRPCCDQDDAVFYWEANEFLKNPQADVRANTYFHDCWHVVQFELAGRQYAYTLVDQIRREVDAISHQIGVAHLLGCSPHEIQHLEDFRRDQRRIAERLDEGVNRLAAHRPGELSAVA